MGTRIFQWGRFTSYALMAAARGPNGALPQGGDVASLVLENQICTFQYDDINVAWRCLYRMYATTADLAALQGLFGGDPVYLVDTGQTAFYDQVHFVWVYVP